MQTIYETMKHNYTHGVKEKGVATFLHPMGEMDAYALRYHATDVVIAHPDGSVTLNSGGFNVPRIYNGRRPVPSPTTLERISRYLPESYGIYQSKNKWWISTPTGDTLEFKDGMAINTPDDQAIQDSLDGYALANFYGMR